MTEDADRRVDWHPDRIKPNVQRYWNGTEWSAQRQWVGGRWEEYDPASQKTAATSPQPVNKGRSRRWILGGIVLVALAAAVGTGVALASRHSPSSGSAKSTNITSDASTTTAAVGEPADVACNRDWRIVAIAVDGYNAQYHHSPNITLPWTASNYQSNYELLTNAPSGSLLPKADVPATTHYTVFFGPSGDIYIGPPNQFHLARDADAPGANAEQLCAQFAH
jgi:hypothetical protein